MKALQSRTVGLDAQVAIQFTEYAISDLCFNNKQQFSFLEDECNSENRLQSEIVDGVPVYGMHSNQILSSTQP